MSPRRWWTDQRVAVLRERLGAGASAGEVALELGCSRNAVCGKAHALNALNGSAAQIPRAAKSKSRPRGTVPAVAHDVRLLDEIAALPVDAGVRLSDLRARHCRWVRAPGAPWVFCGDDVACGSYCAAHARLVYVSYRKGLYDDDV